MLAVAALIPAAASAAQRPIVYAVVLDGLDGDRVEQGGAPFISSLLAGEGGRGTYFPRSSSVIPAETNPNHTAMMSGAYPGSSGVAANAFALYAPLASEDSCAPTGPFDFSVLPTETSGESPTCPDAELVFEAIRRQGNPDRLVSAAIFGKPKLGRIFAGTEFRADRRDADYLWAPCSEGSDDDSYCGDVPVNPISGYAVDDAAVMDVVLESADGVAVGSRSRRPDFTFVNLHQIDSAGHSTGVGGIYDTAIAQADDQVERLVSALRERGEWKRTVLILLSDHSMEATPSKLSLTDTLTGAGVSEAEFLAVDNGSVDLIYLADREAGARFELLARMREAILAESGITEVLYREPNPLDGGKSFTVDRFHPEWNSAGPRSGDLFVISDPGVAFSEGSPASNPLIGNHGAPQTADNFLAVTGGSPLVRTRTVNGPGRSSNPVNVDVAPTVMGLLGLAAPADSRGRFLRKAFKRKRLRRVARPAAPEAKLTGGAIVIAAKGGRHDVEALVDGSWRRIATATRRSRLAPRRLPERADAFRVRARSAAGIAGAWERLGLR